MIDRAPEAPPEHISEALATLIELAADTADRRLTRGCPRPPDPDRPPVRHALVGEDPIVQGLIHRNALITNGIVRQRSLSDFLR